MSSSVEVEPYSQDDFGTEAERRYIEEHYKVTDEELIARVNAAPDMGGAILADMMAAGEACYEGDPPFDDVCAPVHLLFLDEFSVRWSFDRQELDQALSGVVADGNSFAHNAVLTLNVSTDMARQLSTLQCPDKEAPFR